MSSTSKIVSASGLVLLLNKMSELVMTHVPDQKYSDDNGVLSQIATDIINSKPELVSQENLNVLLQFREKFEEKISKAYKVKYITGLSAFTQDLQAVYDKKKVIKPTQIKSGLLDSLIGKIHKELTNSIY